jgi:hypothetical protein
MRSFIRISSTAVVVAALSAVAAPTSAAQCAFAHPSKTKDMVLPLVQAFVPCNVDPACTLDGQVNAASTGTNNGIPGCAPTETYNERAGAPPNGWRWGERAWGTVSFRAVKNRVMSPANPVPNTADVEVRVEIVGIEDADGPAEGHGVMVPERRTTFEDRTNGDMTLIDLAFPSFGVPVTNGHAKVRTTANAILNASGFPGAPGCTALELGRLQIHDENGNPFAVPGLFMPDINPN